jgi:hypothetical protein
VSKRNERCKYNREKDKDHHFEDGDEKDVEGGGDAEGVEQLDAERKVALDHLLGPGQRGRGVDHQAHQQSQHRAEQ